MNKDKITTILPSELNPPPEGNAPLGIAGDGGGVVGRKNGFL